MTHVFCNTLLALEGKGRTSHDQEKLSTHGANAEMNLKWCFCVCATDAEPHEVLSGKYVCSPLAPTLRAKVPHLWSAGSVHACIPFSTTEVR